MMIILKYYVKFSKQLETKNLVTKHRHYRWCENGFRSSFSHYVLILNEVFLMLNQEDWVLCSVRVQIICKNFLFHHSFIVK